MRVLEFGGVDYNKIWLQVLSDVMFNGDSVYIPETECRGKRSGGLTKEIRDMVIVIKDPIEPTQEDIDKLATTIGIKFLDNMLILPDSPQYERIYENGQYDSLLTRLKLNLFTRRAVFSVFLPQDILSNYGICSISGQFLFRDHKLSLRVFMRSNDAYNAFPLNMIGFIKLQYKLAHDLSVSVGEYIHYATSMHIYATDFKKVNELLKHINVEGIV